MLYNRQKNTEKFLVLKRFLPGDVRDQSQSTVNDDQQIDQKRSLAGKLTHLNGHSLTLTLFAIQMMKNNGIGPPPNITTCCSHDA